MKLHNHTSGILSFAFGLILLLMPQASHASTVAVTQVSVTSQEISTSQELSAELSQISAELPSAVASDAATFSLTPGQSTTQASSSPSGGLLKISLPNFAHTNPDLSAKYPQPITNLAVITLQYMPCLAAAPSVCIAAPSASYPVMTSDLASGQLTGYLHYLVTLTSLSTTTATFQVTDSSYLTNLQNQVNAIAAKVQALLGK